MSTSMLAVGEDVGGMPESRPFLGGLGGVIRSPVDNCGG
ncbi:hypothetical protein FHS23_002447 [Prauserella isguenensis]|uniref:Uncharacterized protein n=1 Tax=Prauserella isguenensis TaxID=1470180 RepID=A0A839S277_9PSEU|nr:hypothetical protein [Prauserella isguenensis]